MRRGPWVSIVELMARASWLIASFSARGPVDKASASGAEDRTFESCRAQSDAEMVNVEFGII